MNAGPTHDELTQAMDHLHALASGVLRNLFELVAEADDRQAWRGSGARDIAHFISIRYGISWWKADRWIKAAHALKRLPRLSQAFGSGELGIDNVVELARLATPGTEASLICWAKGVSSGAIRRRADLEARSSRHDAERADRDRRLCWWYFDEGRRLALEAELPAAEGAVVARAIERLADRLPVMPGENDPYYAEARRADALVGICSQAVAADPDPERATVVIHARLDGLASGKHSSEIEGGGVANAATVRRLLCTARLQTVVEDQSGNVLGLGRVSREPSACR